MDGAIFCHGNVAVVDVIIHRDDAKGCLRVSLTVRDVPGRRAGGEVDY